MSGLNWRLPGRFTQEDIIAYHLGDLPPGRASRLRRALAVDAALAAESIAALETLDAFPRGKDIPVLTAEELNRHWVAVRPHLQAPIAPTATSTPIYSCAWFRCLLAVGSLAAFAALCVLTVERQHRSLPSEQEMATAPKPALEYSHGDSLSHSSAVSLAQQQISSSQEAIAPARGVSPVPGTPFRVETLRPSDQAEGLSPQVVVPNSGPTLSYTVRPPAVASSISPEPPHGSTEMKLATRGSRKGRRHSFSSDVSLGIFGNVIAGKSFNTASTAITGDDFHAQSSIPAVGAIASFHQQFSPLVGYRVTGAYSRPSLDYTYRPATTPAAQPSTVEITTRVVELSGTYVAEGPHTRRVHTSVEAGGGVLLFHPQQSGTMPGTVARPTGIVGLRAELAISQHLSVSAQYRAFVFATPDFHNPTSAVPLTSTVVVSSQPSVGITYRFGKPHP